MGTDRDADRTPDPAVFIRPWTESSTRVYGVPVAPQAYEEAKQTVWTGCKAYSGGLAGTGRRIYNAICFDNNNRHELTLMKLRSESCCGSG